MSNLYQDENVLAVLNKASFLDPRFKTLAHLTAVEQQDTMDSIIDELVDSCHNSVGVRVNGTSSSCEESPAKRPKQNLV